MDINDLVSPSDQRLLELAGGLTEDLGIVKDIFNDRNTPKVSSSFAFGVVTTVIFRLLNIKVNEEEFLEFLANQVKED